MLYYIISYHIISYHIISYYMFISPALSAGRTGMSLPTTKLCSESDFAISVLLEIPTRGFAFGPSHLPWIALPYAKRERGTRRRGHAQHIHVYIYIYRERERAASARTLPYRVTATPGSTPCRRGKGRFANKPAISDAA